jgi:hypothetical protein
MAVFLLSPEDDVIDLSQEPNTIVIEPGSGHDNLEVFQSGRDTLIFNGFGFTSPDDLQPFFTYQDDGGRLLLDLSAAYGGEPGTQTLWFPFIGEVHGDSILFDIGPTPKYTVDPMGKLRVTEPEPSSPEPDQSLDLTGIPAKSADLGDGSQ